MGRSLYDDHMSDCNGNGRGSDRFVMVNHDGQRTLFQLVEVGKERDILQLSGELPPPSIVIEIALPALPAIDQGPGRPAQLTSPKLILLNVKTLSGNDANGVVVRRFVHERSKPVAGAVARTDPSRLRKAARRNPQ
jgi:hypothetical protein